MLLSPILNVMIVWDDSGERLARNERDAERLARDGAEFTWAAAERKDVMTITPAIRSTGKDRPLRNSKLTPQH